MVNASHGDLLDHGTILIVIMMENIYEVRRRRWSSLEIGDPDYSPKTPRGENVSLAIFGGSEIKMDGSRGL